MNEIYQDNLHTTAGHGDNFPECPVDGCRVPARTFAGDLGDGRYQYLCANHRRKLVHRIERGWSDPFYRFESSVPVRETDTMFRITLFSGQKGDDESQFLGFVDILSSSKNSASRKLNRMAPQLKSCPRAIRKVKEGDNTPSIYITNQLFPFNISLTVGPDFPCAVIGCAKINCSNIEAAIEQAKEAANQSNPPHVIKPTPEVYDCKTGDALLEDWFYTFVQWAEMWGFDKEIAATPTETAATK